MNNNNTNFGQFLFNYYLRYTYDYKLRIFLSWLITDTSKSKNIGFLTDSYKEARQIIDDISFNLMWLSKKIPIHINIKRDYELDVNDNNLIASDKHQQLRGRKFDYFIIDFCEDPEDVIKNLTFGINSDAKIITQNNFDEIVFNEI